VQKNELPAAMQKHKAKKACLVPVILGQCTWKPYVGTIQSLPTGGKPLNAWRPYDNAYFDIEQGLRRVISETSKLISGSGKSRVS
jgi:hypothetical protein